MAGLARGAFRELGTVLGLSLFILTAGGQWSPAAAQSTQLNSRLMDKIEALERDLRTVERFVYKGGTAPAQPATTSPAPATAPVVGSGNLADAEARLSQLEADMRRLNGDVEVSLHKLGLLEKTLERLIQDVDLRLSEIEGKLAQQPVPPSSETTAMAAQPDAAGETTASSDTPSQQPAAASDNAAVPAPVEAASSQPAMTVLPEGSPEVQYNFALSLLRKSSFDEAEAAFTAFLQVHGDDPLAGNAQYWLGETHYVRENFHDAARAFLDGYQKYSDSPKAPDTLLKLAITLARLDQKPDACAALAELENKFPKASRPIKRRAEREKQASGCN